MKLIRFLVLRMVKIILAVVFTTSIGAVRQAAGRALVSPEAQTHRVALGGSDISSCGSETTPCQSIQYAANKAASGDTLLVAGGTYTYKASADDCSFLTTGRWYALLMSTSPSWGDTPLATGHPPIRYQIPPSSMAATAAAALPFCLQ